MTLNRTLDDAHTFKKILLAHPKSYFFTVQCETVLLENDCWFISITLDGAGGATLLSTLRLTGEGEGVSVGKLVIRNAEVTL